MAGAGVDSVSLVLELKSINCCDCCIIRFLNEKGQNTFNNAKSFIAKILQIDINNDLSERQVKLKKQNACSACLGLLQEETIDTYFDKVIEDVKEANYDCDEITFALSFPIALILRNFSIWLYISKKFSKFYSCRMLFDQFDVSDELRADGNIVSLKEAWKSLVAPRLAAAIGKSLNNGIDSKFHVTINFEYPDDGEETACMAKMHPHIFADRGNQKRKYHNEIFTRKSVEAALEKTSPELFAKHCVIPPSIPTFPVSCTSTVCCHDSIYIAGRYNKFSRSLSQTPWVIRGERKMESSVEELIIRPVAEMVSNDDIKFSSSGREDVDVRTLGIGRPFVLDVQNPRRIKLTSLDMKSVQLKVNDSTKDIQIRDLQVVPKEDLVHIKTGERLKTKTYHCVCVVRGLGNEEIIRQKLPMLSNLESFVINQRTPVRVLHRRPLASRPRTVHWVKGEAGPIDGENIFFTLKLKVEAGTYIKELVHGDLGRTVPSISSIIGVEADIVALDVEAIDLAWPPSIEEDKGCS